MPQNGLNGLTFEQVHRIRTARLPDEYFAKVHGLCVDSIANARCGRTYKDHPTPPAPKVRPAKGKHSFGGAAPSDDIGIEPKDQALYERLRAWVEVDTDGCWIWTGAYLSNKHPSGQHGTATVPGRGTMGAHRAMWIALYGEIPDGLHVLHRCDKPRCIHPRDLWDGTHAQNMADMKAKGRHAQSAQKTCKRGHPLPPPNIDGRRPCPECLRMHSREYERRKRRASTSTPEPT
jgi:hypothetical protein